MIKSKGYSLIELVIFIVIVTIIASTILLAMDMVLKTSYRTQENGIATQAASRCLEWYWGQNQMNGYSSITCGSTIVPSFCATPSGFSLGVNVVCSTLNGEDYKTVTVNVTGKGTSSLSVMFGDDDT